MIQTNEATDSLLDGFSPKVPTDVPDAVNIVMTQLTRAYLTKEIKPLLSSMNKKSVTEIWSF